MPEAVTEAPIPFTQEECAAMVKRKPVMARFLEMGKEMGIVQIVEQKQVVNHGTKN